MAKSPVSSTAGRRPPTDLDLAEGVARRDPRAFEALMRRYNARLFRVARAILKNDAEAEDVLQEGYLQAYRRIADFRGDAQLSTWLTRIVVNQALMRLRRSTRDRAVVSFEDWAGDGPREGDVADHAVESASDSIVRAELRRLLEKKIDALPERFRTVFVMREVEDMTVEETAECLSIPPATVRSRFFRARALLRDALARDIDLASSELFGFAGERCDRIVAGVLAALVNVAPSRDITSQPKE
jgi:RNA polymerase sigma-70 factor, ECF subfamily